MKYCSFVAMWNEICPHSRQRIFHICGANISQRSYFTCPKGQISLKKALAFASAFFWWGMVDSDHRSQWQQIYSLPPLAAREFPLELVIGVEPTTCWLQISCSAIEPHQHAPFFTERAYYSTTKSKCQEFFENIFKFFEKIIEKSKYFFQKGLDFLFFCDII